MIAFRATGSAAIVCLLSTINVVLTSPVYDNRTLTATRHAEISSSATGSATIPASLGIGDYVIQGIDDAGAKDLTDPSPSAATRSNTIPTTTVADNYYTGQLLSNSVWHLFTSKTERPIVPVSWASPMPEVEKCWSDIVTWRRSSISWWNKYIASTKFSNTVLTTQTTIWAVTETAIETTIYPTSASAYTLCDGSPRVDIRPQTSTTTTNVTKSLTLVVPQEFAFPQTQPCIPDSRTCRLWYYESNMNVTNEDELLQQCGRPTGLYEPCLVAGGPVQLIYWPEGNGESNICPNNASMSLRHPSYARNTSTTTLPATITALGHTFTSGSVYLSFHTLYASYDGFWDRVGPTFKDTIIPVPSSVMSTHCGGFTEARGPGTALNYADLNWPVAASAYNCQARCDNWRFVSHDNRSASAPECQTIWNDVNPNIVIPTLVRDLVPEWAHCEMSGFRIPNFWHDPPVALTMKASIAVPTTPHAKPTQEPASPSSGIVNSTPTETGLAADPTAGSPKASTETQSPKTSTQTDWTSEAGASNDPQPSKIPTNLEVTFSEQEPGTTIIALPLPHDTTGSAVTALSEISNSAHIDENAPDPTNPVEPLPSVNPHIPLETTSTSTLFSYQPESSSLNALSVLQSALSALSETAQSHESQIVQLPETEGTTTTHDSIGVSNTIEETPNSALPDHSSGTLPILTSAEGSRSPAEIESTTDGSAAVTVLTENPHTASDEASTTSTSAESSQSLAEAEPTTSGNAAVTTSTEFPHTASDEPSLTSTSSHSNQNSATTTDSSDVPISASSSRETPTEVPLPSVVIGPPPNLSTLAAADLTVTASQIPGSPGVLVLGSHTLHPDDPVATFSGHVISALPSGLALLSSDSTVTFSHISADSDRSLVALVAGSLTVTAEVAAGSGGAISVGETTLAQDGDYATLQDGHTLHFRPSGIEAVKSNSTLLMSSMTGTAAVTTATSSSSASSRTAEYPTETSSPAESAGKKRESCLLGWLGVMMLLVTYVMC